MSPKEKGSSTVMIAAIDFGTTYSGYAFGFKSELDEDPTQVSCFQWHGTGGIMSLKFPTTVLLNEKEELLAFGYEAEEMYSGEEHLDYFYFHRFKMMLYDQIRKERLTMDTKVKDIRGREMPALEIFTHAVKFMKNHLFNNLEGRGIKVEDSEIIWVLTVPAIWDDPAKQFMRKAAEKAGIPKKTLRIALEPEAASIWCKTIPVEKLNQGTIVSFQEDTKYLVLDAGGGTVDMTIHQVIKEGKLKELARASGGAWGGISVDAEFEAALIEIVGKDLMDTFRQHYTVDYLDLFRSFELKKRSKKEGCENDDVILSVPVSFVEICDSLERMIAKSRFRGNIELEMDKLIIKPSTFDSFFKPTCQKVVKHVENLLQSSKAEGVEFMLMVGGFSESTVLQKAVKDAFSPKYRVVIPQEAGLAVLSGAVLFGNDPSVIQCRIAQRTYGIASTSNFNSRIHKESKKINVNGIDKCNDLFSRHVKIDDELYLHVAQAEKTYTPIKADQTSMRISLYKSNNDDTMYVDDQECVYLGGFDVPMTDTTGGLNREVKVRLLFGDTEIEVKCLVVKTKAEVSGHFSFLEPEP
uniref:Heat shock 70 kDa protein 12A n=1 Tax=Magallana gigas TaxID=29159 RepID=K1PQR6_MAGGI